VLCGFPAVSGKFFSTAFTDDSSTVAGERIVLNDGARGRRSLSADVPRSSFAGAGSWSA